MPWSPTDVIASIQKLKLENRSALPGSCDKWSPARQATVPEGQETQLVEGLKA